jgi:hypothetical protein
MGKRVRSQEMIRIILLLLAIIGLTIPITMNVEASGFGRCGNTEATAHSCEERDRHPETYCIVIEEDRN